ncbi:alpha/beta fold hydrolase [Ancylobacter sp. IITR112]|uniref:alpha/beta fold hydrolase n=1 Tax=Ancylobacter sp. IITR112 TaxID=3138073 RepID=UPI00352B4107
MTRRAAHTSLALAGALSLALAVVSHQAAAEGIAVRNIVLVHGAWVDGSGWRAVYDHLVAKGFHVSIVQEPETSFADDVAATTRVLDRQDGPTLLVGHSYGGSIITQAGVHPKVAGLVYVAAHAPDIGEDEATLGKTMPSVLAKTEGAVQKTPDGFTSLDPTLFPSLFAPDLALERAQFEARGQVPAAASVFSTPLTAAAWQSKPSWGIVAGADQIINPELERFYYERAGAPITTIPGASHSVYESHPREVAAVIGRAAAELAEGAPGKGASGKREAGKRESARSAD